MTITRITVEDFSRLPFAAKEALRAKLAAHGFPPGSGVVWTEIRTRKLLPSLLTVAQKQRDDHGNTVIADGTIATTVTTVRLRRG